MNKHRRNGRNVLEIDFIIRICICKLSCFCQVVQITPTNLKNNGVLFKRKCQESVLNVAKKKLRPLRSFLNARLLYKQLILLSMKYPEKLQASSKAARNYGKS